MLKKNISNYLFKKKLKEIFGENDFCHRCGGPRPKGSLMFCVDCAGILLPKLLDIVPGKNISEKLDQAEKNVSEDIKKTLIDVN